ncbi:MAG TPA: sugar porter family MFS transporter [Acidobacteriaceae bacterium]|nr:sugar porter family MFS transporter [Acidobacteriaceae bacterium]
MQSRRFYVWWIATIAALGGLLFGYDWVVIGGAEPFYESHFAIASPSTQGWAMSCALVGCFLGSLLSGALSERMGRKPALIAAALVFTITSIGTGTAGSFTAFVLWRISGGLAIGLASALSPMYIAEIAPAGMRGRLVSLNELTIVTGVLSAQVMNWLIADGHIRHFATEARMVQWDAATGWRWMFGVTAVPAALFLLGMLFVPESPRWLALRNREAEARRTLVRLGGEESAGIILAEIEASLRSADHTGSLRAELSQLLAPGLRAALVLGVGLAVLQQWCGINVIFNYAHDIFAAAGYGLSDIMFNIVVTGITMLIFTFLAIATVDHGGRRPLMLGGCAGLAIVYIALGWFFHLHSRGVHMLALVVAALACYAMTLAPITWVVLSEIFPSRVRATAMAVSSSSLWAACFVLTYTFPLLNNSLGTAGTFWLYASVCVLGFIGVYRFLPETKGRTLEEIETFWKPAGQ